MTMMEGFRTELQQPAAKTSILDWVDTILRSTKPVVPAVAADESRINVARHASVVTSEVRKVDQFSKTHAMIYYNME